MGPAEHAINPEEVMELLDGELPAERAAVVRGHLATCKACQELSASLRQVSGDVSRWQVEEPPATLVVPQPAASKPRWPQQWSFNRVMLVSVSLVALVVLAPLLTKFNLDNKRARSFAMSQATPPLPPPPSVSAATEVSPLAAPVESPAAQQPVGRGPSIARTARLRIVAGDFDAARVTIDRIVTELHGTMQQVDVENAGSTPRTLNATLLIPSKDLEAAIGRLRAVGQVTNESQAGEDVSDQLIDLDARLSNARNTEKRLVELLRDRTGKLSDVLEAEREVARVREEIERTDAQRQQLDRRVVYATVNLQLSEQPKAAIDLGPLPISLQLKNAFVDGIEAAVESAMGAAFLVARAGPVLILWAAIFAWPIRILMRRQRVRA